MQWLRLPCCACKQLLGSHQRSCGIHQPPLVMLQLCPWCAYLAIATDQLQSCCCFHCSAFQSLHEAWIPKFFKFLGFNLLLAFGASLSLFLISPAAAGSGIPNVKAYLNGVESPVFRNFFTIKTFVAKVIGSALAVGSSLVMGKEGPMLHAGSILAVILGEQQSQLDRRTTPAAATAAVDCLQHQSCRNVPPTARQKMVALQHRATAVPPPPPPAACAVAVFVVNAALQQRVQEHRQQEHGHVCNS